MTGLLRLAGTALPTVYICVYTPYISQNRRAVKVQVGKRVSEQHKLRQHTQLGLLDTGPWCQIACTAFSTKGWQVPPAELRCVQCLKAPDS